MSSDRKCREVMTVSGKWGIPSTGNLFRCESLPAAGRRKHLTIAADWELGKAGSNAAVSDAFIRCPVACDFLARWLDDGAGGKNGHYSIR